MLIFKKVQFLLDLFLVFNLVYFSLARLAELVLEVILVSYWFGMIPVSTVLIQGIPEPR